jgi:hypothetical protein
MVAEQNLIANWVQPHLVNVSDEIGSVQGIKGSWGNFEKQILLLVNSNNIENDSALLEKVILLTADFCDNDFYFLPLNFAEFSLLEITQSLGAEKIFVFGFTPIQAGIFIQGLSDEPFELRQKTICFLPSVEKCVTDLVYKKRFAQIWLKILQTKWITK